MQRRKQGIWRKAQTQFLKVEKNKHLCWRSREKCNFVWQKYGREDSDWKQNLGSILQAFVCLINNS